MKKILLLVTALGGHALGAYAQAPAAHPFAVGLEGAAYNWTTQPAQPRFQALSGVAFRYVPRRLGWRAGVALSQRTASDNPANCADCPVGQTDYQTLTLRAGGQYAPLSQAPWLYGFLDVAYRNVSAEGQYTGGLCGCLDFATSDKTRSAGAMVGVGASYPITPRFFIGPELYFESFTGRATNLTTDRKFGQQQTYSQPTKSHSPAIRFQAMVSF